MQQSLLAYHDGSGTAKPSWDTLQTECALGRSSLGDALRGLKEKGYVSVKRRWNDSSVYTTHYKGKSGFSGLTFVDSWLEVLKDERGKALSMAFAASQKATRWIVEQSTRRRAAQRSQLSKSDAPALPVKGGGEAEIGSIPP